MEIGLVGLGNMGKALAERFSLKHDVYGFDANADRRNDLKNLEFTVVDNLSALGKFKYIVLSLPNAKVSNLVVDDLFTYLQPGSTIVETSTVKPEDMVNLQNKLKPVDINVVDASLLSGVAQMESGEAAVLLGGTQQDTENVYKIFDGLVHEISMTGDLGSAMAAKVINNAVAHAVMVVLTEALALGAATGVSGKSLVKILEDPDRGMLRPLKHRIAERILNGEYAGGMPIEAARKDSALALSLAQENNVPLFATMASDTVYELAVSKGYQRLDYAAIAKLWEEWMNLDFSSPEISGLEEKNNE